MAATQHHGFKRVWFITGASRGIGALIAEAALADGNAVVAAGRNVSAIVERLGESAALLPVALDVSDEAQARAAVQAAVERFGRIDVLVNNAGFGLLGAVEESSDKDVRRMYDTNVFGLLNVTRATLPTMRANRSGHVINISSIGGYRAAAGFGVYSSTKFAVEGSPKRCMRNCSRSAFTRPSSSPAISARIFSMRRRWSSRRPSSTITTRRRAPCVARPPS